ncbi:MAG: corrinoid protein [Treponema sp.]|jgi:methanogenic corrinoid protein MtbC1|nr:corrinoid protein [Treponema sp.]
MAKIDEIAAAISAGKAKDTPALVEAALAEGLNPLVILNDAMIATMDAVGQKFKDGEIFVPEMLIAARAMKKGVEVLKPRLSGDGVTGLGKCVIGTVAGDMHDIGKNLVAMMIESAGFEIIDLGVDVQPAVFIDAVKSNSDVKIVALSALLTTTMPAMKDTITAIKAANIAGGFKLIVGGAPVSQEFADQIGADGYSPDAASAAVLAKKLGM